MKGNMKGITKGTTKGIMKVFVYGDNVDTDVIIPARYLTTGDPAHLAAHCMEDIDPGFSTTVKEGDVVVAGWNFGCGSSREHAPLALKAAGIACVVAASFARIFYRNAINIGLPIIENAEAARDISPGDAIDVSPEAGRIHNLTTGRIYQGEPPPPFIMEIIQAGGLLQRLKNCH
ncbi:MAG: 3-isopropylmalate dehydratase small subunit [Oscillospiraceae bacterium]|nr:3-isopropylmalate dehydratase small subunit [Oscillospiraceae bacterium]